MNVRTGLRRYWEKEGLWALGRLRWCRRRLIRLKRQIAPADWMESAGQHSGLLSGVFSDTSGSRTDVDPRPCSFGRCAQEGAMESFVPSMLADSSVR